MSKKKSKPAAEPAKKVEVEVEVVQVELEKASWEYELGQQVELKLSQESGYVEGRAEYQVSEKSYYVLYKAADGRQVSAWWAGSQIK